MTINVRQALHEEGANLYIGELKGESTHGVKRRTITISQEAVASLQRQKAKQNEARLRAGEKWSPPDVKKPYSPDLVFTDRNGGYVRRTNVMKRDMQRIHTRAGLLVVANRLGVSLETLLEANKQLLDANKRLRYSKPLREGTELRDPRGGTYRVQASVLLEGVTLHTFRHTHASLLIFRGVNIKTVSARLGHESVTFTYDTYGHLLPGSDEKAAEAMDNFIANLQ